jgi:hypothetical protein
MFIIDFCSFKLLSATYDSTYPAEEYDNKDVDDNCKPFNLIQVKIDCFEFCLLEGALMYLNQANLLQNVKLRYKKDVIYVSYFSGPKRTNYWSQQTDFE